MKAMVVSLPKKIVLLLCTAVFYTTGAFAYDSVNPERNAAVPQGQIEWKPVFPRALFLNKPEISVMEAGGLAGPIEYQDILKNKERAEQGLRYTENRMPAQWVYSVNIRLQRLSRL